MTVKGNTVASTDIIDSIDDRNIIKCIFLCKFHATAGPQIAAQVPENYISKEVFDTISRYVIPKLQLERCFLSLYVSIYIVFINLKIKQLLHQSLLSKQSKLPLQVCVCVCVCFECSAAALFLFQCKGEIRRDVFVQWKTSIST